MNLVYIPLAYLQCTYERFISFLSASHLNMESQHPPVRTGGIYINSRVNCGEHPCDLSGLELVK